jgi:dihydrofolate reductase
MRKIVYGAAWSLDGFIAGKDGSLDWLLFSADVQQELRDQWKRYDTVLMGRHTWAAGRDMGAGDSPIPGAATYIFSRTLSQGSVGTATVVRDDAAEFVRRLKRAPGKDICLMGGGVLAQAMFEARLIDEVGVNIHPLLLGGGTPLFRDLGRRVPMELLSSRAISGGCVLATYRVVS